MRISILLEESDGQTNPGHMVVGVIFTQPKYYGYRFDPDDLPSDYRDSSRWREYLFENHIPGHIVDESSYIAAVTESESRHFLGFEWMSTGQTTDMLPPRKRWLNFALYSFNPDDTPKCYNCVTWATKVVADLVPRSLHPVRHGRIKLMARQIRALQPTVQRQTKPEEDPTA